MSEYDNVAFFNAIELISSSVCNIYAPPNIVYRSTFFHQRMSYIIESEEGYLSVFVVWINNKKDNSSVPI